VREFKGHTEAVRSVAFSPDGRRALSGSRNGTLRLWDIETGEEIGRFVRERRAPGEVFSVAFAPNGRRILAGGWAKNAKGQYEPELLLWRVPSDTELWAWCLMGGKFPEPPEKK